MLYKKFIITICQNGHQQVFLPWLNPDQYNKWHLVFYSFKISLPMDPFFYFYSFPLIHYKTILPPSQTDNIFESLLSLFIQVTLLPLILTFSHFLFLLLKPIQYHWYCFWSSYNLNYLIWVKEKERTGFSEGKGNSEEQPCQPEENSVLPDSFTQAYIQFEIGLFYNYFKCNFRMHAKSF